MAHHDPENGNSESTAVDPGRTCAKCNGRPSMDSLFGAWIQCMEPGCEAVLCSEECIDLHMLFHLDYESELDKLF